MSGAIPLLRLHVFRAWKGSTLHFRISRIHLSLVTRFRMHGVIHPLPHMPSWAGDFVITGTIVIRPMCLWSNNKTKDTRRSTLYSLDAPSVRQIQSISYTLFKTTFNIIPAYSINFSSLYVLLLKCTIVFTTSCMLQVLVISSVIWWPQQHL
jgi:hypothetical protein